MSESGKAIGHDKSRRRDLAREALDVQDFHLGMSEDPYWLSNLSGKVKVSDLSRRAENLRADADVLNEAVEKIENDDWLPEEAAIYIARNSNYGAYSVRSWLDQEMPITEEP